MPGVGPGRKLLELTHQSVRYHRKDGIGPPGIANALRSFNAPQTLALVSAITAATFLGGLALFLTSGVVDARAEPVTKAAVQKADAKGDRLPVLQKGSGLLVAYMIGQNYEPCASSIRYETAFRQNANSSDHRPSLNKGRGGSAPLCTQDPSTRLPTSWIFAFALLWRGPDGKWLPPQRSLLATGVSAGRGRLSASQVQRTY